MGVDMARFAASAQQGTLFITSSWLWEKEQLFLLCAKSNIRSDGTKVLIPFADALLAIVHHHFTDSDKKQVEDTVTELFAADPAAIGAHYTPEDILEDGALYLPPQVLRQPLDLCFDSGSPALTLRRAPATDQTVEQRHLHGYQELAVLEGQTGMLGPAQMKSTARCN